MTGVREAVLLDMALGEGKVRIGADGVWEGDGIPMTFAMTQGFLSIPSAGQGDGCHEFKALCLQTKASGH